MAPDVYECERTYSPVGSALLTFHNRQVSKDFAEIRCYEGLKLCVCVCVCLQFEALFLDSWKIQL